MRIIDTHCHLYLEEFKNDLKSVIERAENTGIKKFYLPAIDSTFTDQMFSLEKNFPGKCIAMMGLHPCSVKENFKEELKLAEQWLNARSFAAIGEIGLDFYWDKTFAAQQCEVFQTQTQWALQRNMPIVIHTRNAIDEAIATVKPFADKGLYGIFHCFSGSYEQAKRIINMNFFLGIGGVITYKNSGLQPVVEKINLEHIVLETDAPYLTPVPFRGKRNESSYLKYIISKIAEAKNISEEDVAMVTTANAEKIFGS